MALKQTVALDSGLILEEGYIKVVTAEIDNTSGTLEYHCNLYLNQPAREQGCPALVSDYFHNRCDATDIEGNILEQAYEDMKKFPQFTAALDC